MLKLNLKALMFSSESTRIDFNWLVSDSSVASSSDMLIDPLNLAAADSVLMYLGAADPGGTGAVTAGVMNNGMTVFKSAVCLLIFAAPLSGIPCNDNGIAQDVSGNRIPAQADLSYLLL